MFLVESESRIAGSRLGRCLAPVIPELEQLGWNVAFIEAAQKSGALNCTAAILTAIAVVLTTSSTIVGLLPL
ncbi:hypothetical protein ACFPTO_03905 [Paraburkholderia denitrificans]|uniref:Uncharacterized protein n=1 Tax=Paraburkholderia denitrificans TaxID=694025 RepID=A0ABW0J4L2_9BURK